MARAPNIITGEVRTLVCDLHARGYSTVKIAREVTAQGVRVSQQSVWQYLTRRSNLPDIQQAIQKYRSDPLAEEVAHKRVRLADINTERKKVIATLERYTDDKGAYIEKKVSKALYALKRLIEIEVFARDEMEKKPDLLAALWEKMGPYSELTDADLKKQYGVIERKLLVIRQGGPVGKADGLDRQGTEEEG